MSESRADTAQDRPHQPAGDQDGTGHGKHRGGAAATDESPSSAHGRHRRPGDNSEAA